MGYTDKTPFHPEIKKTQNNRFGCALQAIHDYVNKRSLVNVKDKLTLILFNDECHVRSCDLMYFDAFSDEIQKSFKPKGGTNFDLALKQLDIVLERNSSTSYPLLIFLSDGNDQGILGQAKQFMRIESPANQTMQTIAQKQMRQQKCLQVQMVHFGKNGNGTTVLKKLVQISKEVGLVAEFHVAETFSNLQTILLDLHKDVVINPFY